MLDVTKVETLIVSAPSQNHEAFLLKTERLMPLLAARALTSVFEQYYGEKMPQLDMWNCFGKKMDDGYTNSPLRHDLSRPEYEEHILSARYAYLESLGVGISDRIVVRDDSEETISWTTDKLTELANTGQIYEDYEYVNVCHHCDNTISVAIVDISSCGLCKSNDIRKERRSELFVDIDKDSLDDAYSKILLPINKTFLRGQFGTLPPRSLLARQRDYGLPLDFMGKEGKVLDPKIGLGLMSGMVMEKHESGRMIQIQGSETAKNTLPFTASLSPNADISYIMTSRIPSGISAEKVEELGPDFFTKYLPLYLLDKCGNVSQQQIQSISAEYRKASNKFENVLRYFEQVEFDEQPLDQTLTNELNEAFSNICNYNVRMGVLAIRSFVFNKLSRNIVETAKKTHIAPSSDDLKKIEDLVRTVL